MPSSAESASWKSPIEMLRWYNVGSTALRLRVRLAQRGRTAEVNRMRSTLSAAPAVPDLGARHRDGPDPGLHLTLSRLTVMD